MTINGKLVKGNEYAYDGCHKIYIIEDGHDRRWAKHYGYTIYPIDSIKECYKNSCSLKFISNWKLNERYCRQFEQAKFKV